MTRATWTLSWPIISAGTAALALVMPAHGDTVQAQKIVPPAVAETITLHVEKSVSTFPSCQVPAIPPTARPTNGRVVVGFEHASGFVNPQCGLFFAYAYRGELLFRTNELPAQFKSATLVLKAESSKIRDINFPRPFSSIFETSFAIPPQQARFFSSALLHEDSDTRRVTLNQFADVALRESFDNSGLQAQVTGTVQDKGSFNFRVDVTENVNKWVQDWPDRNQTPLRGFVLIGLDESMPSDNLPGDAALVVTYEGHLEFEIDELDR